MRVLRLAASGTWVPSGHVLYERHGSWTPSPSRERRPAPGTMVPNVAVLSRHHPARYAASMTTAPPTRRLRSAEILSIGTELTVGETRDTNAGELARALTAFGVRVERLTAVRDDLAALTDVWTAALARVDLVVSTGGLGPTPDDLTRESIAAVCGETPTVDATLEHWLRALWARRGMPFPELNLKQAWLIPSAESLGNPNGTAPGWYVVRTDGRVLVALPGPPREMRPMWADEVVPRLHGHGLGGESVSRTYRLTGIGESQVADVLGEALLRDRNPEVATYARAEAVDVRISAVPSTASGDDPARTAEELVEQAASIVLERLGRFVWTTGDTTWSGAIGDRLTARGWTLATVEIGTGGALAALLGDVPWLRRSESIASPADRPADDEEAHREGLGSVATRARLAASAEVGLAVRATPDADDTSVEIAVDGPSGSRRGHSSVRPPSGRTP
jgi:nicotinamide-nucleotide amidase